MSAIEEASGRDGWDLHLVGGGRRNKAAHDADFLLTHPTAEAEGLVDGLYHSLVAAGRLVPRGEGGYCWVQQVRSKYFALSFHCISPHPPCQWSGKLVIGSGAFMVT